MPKSFTFTGNPPGAKVENQPRIRRHPSARKDYQENLTVLAGDSQTCTAEFPPIQ